MARIVTRILKKGIVEIKRNKRSGLKLKIMTGYSFVPCWYCYIIGKGLCKEEFLCKKINPGGYICFQRAYEANNRKRE